MTTRRRIERMPVYVTIDGVRYEGEVDPSVVNDLNAPITQENIGPNLRRSMQRGVKLENILIHTTETAVGHGLHTTPHWFDLHMINESYTYWWQTKRPDEKFIYVAASAESVADILIEV